MASVTTLADISKAKTANGYPTHNEIGLPQTLTVTYTGDGYTTNTRDLAAVWLPAVPTDFGKTATTQQFTGIVTTLPAWATGAGTTAVNVNISGKTNIGSELTVLIDGWIYGETAKLSTLTGYTANERPVITYTYSETIPTDSGNYTVKASYEDDTQIDSAMANFSIGEKLVTPKLSVTGVTKPYDKITTVLGTIHPTITFEGTVNSETPTATASGTGVQNPIQAGDVNILHKKLDSIVEKITQATSLSSGHYILEGNKATLWVDSFSTFTFMTMDNVPTPPPDSGNGSGGNGGNSTGGGNHNDSTDNDAYDFWMRVKDKITAAESGDVVKVNVRAYDKMPASVMDTLRKNSSVTLVISSRAIIGGM